MQSPGNEDGASSSSDAAADHAVDAESSDLGEEILARARVLQAKAEDILAALVVIDTGADNLEGQIAAMRMFGDALESLELRSSLQRGDDERPVLRAERVIGRDRRVLLLGHMDTVFPVGTAASRPLFADGGRLYGPGVADMKGGLATIWLAFAVLRDLGISPTVDVDVLINADEELGSTGSRSVIETAARLADLGMVYEPGRPDGAFVTHRRGHRRYRLMVQGRAAHTGVAPESGVNALVELASKVLRISELDAAYPDSNVTVSLASGGTAVNVVPEVAEASIDVRVPNVAVLDDLHNAILAIAARPELEAATLDVTTFAERPPMEELPAVRSYRDELVRVTTRLGLPCDFTYTGGGSDAGIVTSVGTPALDAMGAVGGEIHTAHEYLERSTLAERAAVTACLLAGLM